MMRLFLLGLKTVTPGRVEGGAELAELLLRAAAAPPRPLGHRQDNARCDGARCSVWLMALASTGSFWPSSRQNPIMSVTDLPLASTMVLSAPAASRTLTLARIPYPAASLARLPRPLPPLLLSLHGEQHVQDSCPSRQRRAGQHEGKDGKPPDGVIFVEQETHHAQVVVTDGRALRAGPHD